MRSREFITEKNAAGRLGKRRQQATRGLNIFSDGDRVNTTYELNRVMMAVATTDGVKPATAPSRSWIGTDALAAPYSEQEQAMLKKAYAAVGTDYHDLNNGDMDSEELASTNRQSPVKPFKGY